MAGAHGSELAPARVAAAAARLRVGDVPGLVNELQRWLLQARVDPTALAPAAVDAGVHAAARYTDGAEAAGGRIGGSAAADEGEDENGPPLASALSPRLRAARVPVSELAHACAVLLGRPVVSYRGLPAVLAAGDGVIVVLAFVPSVLGWPSRCQGSPEPAVAAALAAAPADTRVVYVGAESDPATGAFVRCSIVPDGNPVAAQLWGFEAVAAAHL
jgi:hypothetical protein